MGLGAITKFGAIWRGSMYLVADNLSTSEDVREVVAHELIGHYGMRGFFGSELDIVLDEIHKNTPRVRALASDGYFIRHSDGGVSETL